MLGLICRYINQKTKKNRPISKGGERVLIIVDPALTANKYKLVKWLTSCVDLNMIYNIKIYLLAYLTWCVFTYLTGNLDVYTKLYGDSISTWKPGWNQAREIMWNAVPFNAFFLCN